MNEPKHDSPLRKDTPVEITKKTDLDYREVAKSVGTIVNGRRSQEHAEKRAKTDALTELLNQGEFEKDLPAFLARAGEDKSSIGLCIVDGLGIKSINDKYGHTTGNNAIIALARGIERGVRPGDRVYRIGGDEFAVIMPGYGVTDEIPTEEELNTNTAKRIENGLNEASKQIGFPEEAGLDASVGVSVWHGEEPAEFKNFVDSLMYQRKNVQKSDTEYSGGR